MQWAIVNFPDSRDVYIDGVQSGQTNETLAVGDGTHLFDLGLPLNYDPPAVHQPVSGTTYNSPAEIDFTKKSQ
jgi:hypothetical protein